ncbi:Hypothetical protein EHLA_2167 [Anaerobutyricum hallii]|uniref:Uncharacterized protein n=1 Tax=Anaerobutyricum hallii TaxID=39488 RepID=A0A285PT48_9FIRM|nr:hypothetical protein [Anaerobutyricum hallii]SOB72798.1 Hypothetical protein EHLA_2167 [Anaerobutyricum hallii]
MRKSGLTGDEAYALSKRRGTSGDLGPLKKELSLLKEDLSNKITKFYASNQGETHLTDSDNGKIMDMMLYGKSEQKSTMGKNLLKLSEPNVHEGTNINGLLSTMNADGSISVTGTSTSTWSNITKTNNECHTDNATYTFSVDKNSDVVIGLKLGRTKLDDANYQIHRIMQNQLSCTFETGASNEYCSLFLEGLTVGKSYNFTIYPMLELGTEATAYEPYTGGQPSPSPDYPQEIKSVVNPTVKVCGKNLLNATLQTITLNGVTCINNGDGTYTLNGASTVDTDFYIFGAYNTVNKVSLDSQKTYVVKKSGNSKIQFHVGSPDIYTTIVSLEDGQIKNQTTISFFICRILSGAILNNFTIYPQVEEGSASTDFQPYHEQAITLPYTLNAIPVSSDGNITINGQQYVADYVDVEREKLVRMIIQKKLKELDWTNVTVYQTRLNESNGYVSFRSKNIVGYLNEKQAILCKNYIFVKNGWDVAKTLISYVDGLIINDIYSNFGLENWSKDAHISSDIFGDTTFFAELATPQEIDLTSDQIQAFKSLATNYPVTNIEVSSDQLDGLTVFNYPISMANGWNYVKQQLNDNRDYIYDMDTKTQDIDTQAAEAYVNSEYAVVLTELEV